MNRNLIHHYTLYSVLDDMVLQYLTFATEKEMVSTVYINKAIAVVQVAYNFDLVSPFQYMNIIHTLIYSNLNS